jgi:hypothetical protein
MTPKTSKPLLILLDANVIISLHQLGLWSQIINQCQVFSTSCIVFDESKFYSTKNGDQISIDLKQSIDEGKLTVLDADLSDLELIKTIFTDEFLLSLHEGELEALALIAADKHNDCRFCTADGPAIMALAMIGKQQYGISLEELLTQNGLTRQITALPNYCTNRWFNLRITEGNFKRINREGLK